MIYFLAGACVGSLTTFLAMAFVLIADDRKDTEAEQQKAELEEKHWNECRQIAHYADENKRMKEQIEKLIKEYEKC